MSGSAESGSMRRVSELFDAQDPGFLAALREVRFQHEAVAQFTETWNQDPRPWAQAQRLAYFEQPLDVPGHEPITKRLLRHAEQVQDDALMAAILVAFERLVRHQRQRRWTYDRETRESFQREELVLPRNRLPLKASRTERTWRGSTYEVLNTIPPDAQQFSYPTRYYLRAVGPGGISVS